MSTRRDIIGYYQSSQWLYRLFCYDTTTLGMHYGFWEPGVTNRRQAIAAENDAVISFGQIKKGMRVLDAGCGVGGTAIHIARATGARVVGITLDPRRVALATRYAREAGVGDRVTFFVMDFHRMTFPADMFDAAYGIESICYAYPKQKFLREAFRVLKPVGRLVIMDGYAKRSPQREEERRVLHDVVRGFALAPLVSSAQMSRMTRACGFGNIRCIDMTRETWPSVEHFGRLASFVMPIAKLLSHVPSRHLQAIYRNAVALFAVKRAFELGLGQYALHVARKPGR